ncbi:MAG: aminotransferase class V-fold PLP-dependent enzyme [Rubrivivax sp.]|nr:aminotransferase class V-fold PLP-dependent enzyme [Rubrivivax sp.]
MREHFLLDPDITFLNHGSFGATPREVLLAQQRWQLEMERNPVAFLGRGSAALLAAARQRLGEALGAGGDDLVFVPNATTGVNIVVRSLKLAPGDEVLTTDQEYGACIAAWQRRCAETGAVLRVVPVPLPFEPTAFCQRLLAAATPRTRVCFASHIASTTALVFPVHELCAAMRRRGVVTVIDGAHAPGQLPLDLAAVGADFYTGNCHKWLCAPKGSAFLHVRPGDRLGPARLEAPVVSWGYVAEQIEDEGAPGADFTERAGHAGLDAYTGRTPLERRLQWQGTRDLSAFLAVPAALDFQARHDWPAQRRRCHEMALQLQRDVLARNGLAPIAPAEAFAQMVAIPLRTASPGRPAGSRRSAQPDSARVTIGGAADALRHRLFDVHRIEVPVTQHAGAVFVRVSVQAYNTPADLVRLRDALAAEGV